MDANEQFAGGIRAEHLLDETIDLLVAELINFLLARLLFVQALPKKPGGVGVIKDETPGFEFYFKLWYRQGPRAQRLHEPAFEVKKTQQSARIFRH